MPVIEDEMSGEEVSEEHEEADGDEEAESEEHEGERDDMDDLMTINLDKEVCLATGRT